MEYRLPSFLNNKAAFETHGLHVTEIKNQAPGLPSYNRCTTYYHPVNQCYALTAIGAKSMSLMSGSENKHTQRVSCKNK